MVRFEEIYFIRYMNAVLIPVKNCSSIVDGCIADGSNGRCCIQLCLFCFFLNF